MQILSVEDLRQFQLIVDSARREGWLSADASLTAEPNGSSVRVAAVSGSNVLERTYPSDGRWLIRLVRDLAWGEFATDSPPDSG